MRKQSFQAIKTHPRLETRIEKAEHNRTLMGDIAPESDSNEKVDKMGI